MLKHNLQAQLNLQQHQWLVFLLPFLVYALVGALEPAARQTAGAQPGAATSSTWYPLVYTLKIALTLGAIALVLPGYRQFPWRLTPWAIAVGAVGVVIWVGLCLLGVDLAGRLDKMFSLSWLTSLGARPAYNPLQELSGRPWLAWGFLAVRLLGLVVVVPIIEEFFLRGFLMRLVIDSQWWKVPFGKVTPLAAVVGVGAAVLYHPPMEMLAAAVWFSLVTWLMAKTRNIWDCVAAHALTNLLLGIYIFASGYIWASDRWWLW
jgi:CAAX prenyl protease-like protein